MPKKIPLDENTLRQMVQDDMLVFDIARHFEVHKSTIENRMRKLGLTKPRSGPKNGAKHPKFAGSTIRKGYRYLYCPTHPHCINGRYVAEHRLVMEQKLGRLLGRKEVVHHLDGDRLNNDPTNLVIYQTNGEHLRDHLESNPEHAARVRQAMSCLAVRKRIREGLRKHHQAKDSR